MEEFIERFYTIFDDTDFEALKPETVLKDLDEWSSLHALAVQRCGAGKGCAGGPGSSPKGQSSKGVEPGLARHFVG